MCIKCGLAAHVEVSNELMKECLGRPTTHYRRYNRYKFRRVPPQPPMHLKDFPQEERNSYPHNYHIAILDSRSRKRLENHIVSETRKDRDLNDSGQNRDRPPESESD